MRHSRRTWLTVLSLITLVATVTATPAKASLIVNIGGTVSGGAVVGGTTYTDNQVGVDANPLIGIMDIGTFLNMVSDEILERGGDPIQNIQLNANLSATAIPEL